MFDVSAIKKVVIKLVGGESGMMQLAVFLGNKVSPLTADSLKAILEVISNGEGEFILLTKSDFESMAKIVRQYCTRLGPEGIQKKVPPPDDEVADDEPEVCPSPMPGPGF